MDDNDGTIIFHPKRNNSNCVEYIHSLLVFSQQLTSEGRQRNNWPRRLLCGLSKGLRTLFRKLEPPRGRSLVHALIKLQCDVVLSCRKIRYTYPDEFFTLFSFIWRLRLSCGCTWWGWSEVGLMRIILYEYLVFVTVNGSCLCFFTAEI